jgi:hypothetical protein
MDRILTIEEYSKIEVKDRGHSVFINPLYLRCFLYHKLQYQEW